MILLRALPAAVALTFADALIPAAHDILTVAWELRGWIIAAALITAAAWFTTNRLV